MLPNMYTQDAFQQALAFLVSQTTYIEPTVYRLQYPELDYASLVPIDTSAPEWVKSITFFSVDMVGKADWFHAEASDVPMADAFRNKHEAGVEMAAVGYGYNLEELSQAMMIPNWNLTTERAAAAKRAYEEFMYYVALFGDTRKGWYGLFNNPDVTVINATNTWAYQAGLGTQVGLDALLTDFNGLLTNMWISSQTIEMADTVLLPLGVVATLTIKALPNTTMNVMEWLKKYNQYTQQTGQALTIRGIRGLDTAGAGGVARAIAYRRNPEVVKMHVPMPHRFLPAMNPRPLRYDVPGIFRTAGVEIRRPGAFRYLDGI